MQSLRRQFRERGPVGPDVWESERRWEIAKQVTEILNDACWREEFSFHPKDAWAIIGKCEIGDVTDIEALYRIERSWGLKSPCDELWGQVKEGLTFGDVVTYIADNVGTKTAR